MKDKILMLIIGALIGAIITAGCFLIFGNKNYNQFDGKGPGGQSQMGNFTPGEMPEKMENQIAPSQTDGTNSTSNT